MQHYPPLLSLLSRECGDEDGGVTKLDRCKFKKKANSSNSPLKFNMVKVVKILFLLNNIDTRFKNENTINL